MSFLFSRDMFSSLQVNINKPVARVQDPFPWPVVSHNNNKQWHPLPLNRIASETVKIVSGHADTPQIELPTIIIIILMFLIDVLE